MIIYNKLIPIKGFCAMNLFGIIFARKEYKPISPITINHESIHTAQQKELWYVGFYLLYILEWIYRLIFHTKTAYSGISFEKEAYEHQWDLNYLENRKPFNWLKYIWTIKKH